MSNPFTFALTLGALMLSAASICPAQTPDQPEQPAFLELSWMHMKQDKVAEFSQLAKRTADANRRGKGDHFIAYMDFYGRDNYVWFGAARASLAEVESGGQSFMNALKQFMDYTPDRFFADASKTVESSGTELMRYRFDLSWNVKNTDDWAAHMAKAKYVVVVTAHVKPGHMLDAEKQLGMLRDAAVSRSSDIAGAVTQLVTGGDPGTFLVRIPLADLPALADVPTARSLLGDEGYKQYSEMAAQNFASFDYSLKRLVPEWSNPPDSFIKANPEMWTVKPAATSAKPKPAGPEKKTPRSTGQ